MRVVVTDDSAFMRRAVCTMLTADPDIEVVGVAHNGKQAVDLAKTLKPDVITLDIEMPEMDGLTALRHIMRTAPTQVLMLSSLTTEGSNASLQAMKLGAADVLAKDQSQFSMNMSRLQTKLITTVKALAQSNPHKITAAPAAPTPKTPPPRFRPSQFDLVCIGSSTGGPPVLETILATLPASTRPPIVVAQHMPEIFTRSMAERLDKMCELNVIHVEDREEVKSGNIYLARGGKHMQIHKVGSKLEAHVGTEPADAVYRPSVDALIGSAANATAARTLAIVLTGIGADGLAGGKELYDKGGTLLAQSKETCVVYGMPKSVAEAGITTASLSPEDICAALCTLNSATAAA